MKNLFMILILGMFSIVCYSQEVSSTIIGGDWNNPKTWINGEIPNINSDVIINGNVLVNQPISCKNIKITKEGILEFVQSKNSSKANISEIINVADGKFIVNEKWTVYTNHFLTTDIAIIYNSGTLNIEK